MTDSLINNKFNFDARHQDGAHVGNTNLAGNALKYTKWIFLKTNTSILKPLWVICMVIFGLFKWKKCNISKIWYKLFLQDQVALIKINSSTVNIVIWPMT